MTYVDNSTTMYDLRFVQLFGLSGFRSMATATMYKGGHNNKISAVVSPVQCYQGGYN